MKRKFISRSVVDATAMQQQMLNWSKQFSIFCFLDNQDYSFTKPEFDCLLAAGAHKQCENNYNFFDDLQQLIHEDDWVFGHLAYDLKNQFEKLTSENFDGVGFPDGFFFIPEVVIILSGKNIQIQSFGDPDLIYDQLLSADKRFLQNRIPDIKLHSRFTRGEYISTVDTLKQHILRGDCYEINFCQEFYFENAEVDPLQTFNDLQLISPNPFSAFYRLNDKYLMCASPERFLQRTGDHIISQPIKGTARRLADAVLDEQNKHDLLHSEKERSENVMIVDLVRNDLSRICKEGSVCVENLFEIQEFPQVHQMVSTVGGDLPANISFQEIIHATFPMGSMTGAPKKRVMELIEKYERTKRGVFSGSVGYVKPGGDFDFNVVIRSILYNASSRYLSLQAGSAITFASNPEREYEECLMKISGMLKVLKTQQLII